MQMANEISTMDPAERVGYFGAFAVFVIGGILLVVFGIRRLTKRSAMKRQRQYGAGAHHPPTGQQQPPYPPPPSPYAPQPMGWKPDPVATKPPNLAASILMIVLGVLLLLGSLSALAQSAGGSA